MRIRTALALLVLLQPLSVTAEVLTNISPVVSDPGAERRALESAAALGADIALVASTADDMRTLIEARAALVREGKTVPTLGLTLETSSAGEEWVSAAIIRFFRQVPRTHWATLDGEPVVRLTGLHAFKNAHPALFSELRRRFRQALGVNPHIVADDTEAVRALAAISDVKTLGAQMAKLGFWETMATILASPEFYHAAGGQPAGLVDRVFDKWLGRKATAQERVVALERLKAVGANRFSREVVGSEESRRTLVAHWMRRYLDRREPLAVLKLVPEIDANVAALRAGEAPHAVLARMLAAETKGSDEAFVDSLYAKLIRDCSDKAGRSFWLKRVSSGSREIAAREFLTDERVVKLVTAEWVHELLERKYSGTPDETIALGEGSCGASAAARHDVAEYRRVWEELLTITPRPRLVFVDRSALDGARQFADRFHSRGS